MHPAQDQLAYRNLDRALLHSTLSEIRREVVVISLTPSAPQSDALGEGVQLLQAGVTDEVAPAHPVLPGPGLNRGVGIVFERINQDQVFPVSGGVGSSATAWSDSGFASGSSATACSCSVSGSAAGT